MKWTEVFKLQFSLLLCLASKTFLYLEAIQHETIWEGLELCIPFVMWKKCYCELSDNFRQEYMWKLTFCRRISFKLLWWHTWTFFASLGNFKSHQIAVGVVQHLKVSLCTKRARSDCQLIIWYPVLLLPKHQGSVATAFFQN